eukprot:gb/GECG01013298.1/.p1 GENE.gb/GECG01013298.1/~~gb/GECG01013298.1/.p1  ORF type:complete len:315 (+),score=21.38 gb/GECG01013298.1/:1-945(+)
MAAALHTSTHGDSKGDEARCWSLGEPPHGSMLTENRRTRRTALENIIEHHVTQFLSFEDIENTAFVCKRWFNFSLPRYKEGVRLMRCRFNRGNPDEAINKLIQLHWLPNSLTDISRFLYTNCLLKKLEPSNVCNYLCGGTHPLPSTEEREYALRVTDLADMQHATYGESIYDAQWNPNHPNWTLTVLFLNKFGFEQDSLVGALRRIRHVCWTLHQYNSAFFLKRLAEVFGEAKRRAGSTQYPHRMGIYVLLQSIVMLDGFCVRLGSDSTHSKQDFVRVNAGAPVLNEVRTELLESIYDEVTQLPLYLNHVVPPG